MKIDSRMCFDVDASHFSNLIVKKTRMWRVILLAAYVKKNNKYKKLHAGYKRKY